MSSFLGADVGSSKTQVLIADHQGRVVGLGSAGPGNHQVVGYEGLALALKEAADQALAEAGVTIQEISGAGFGISGYDWSSQEPGMRGAISGLGLQSPLEIYNDAVIGLVAGSQEGWGIALVSGSGCNCWGWDRDQVHIGHVTGFGHLTGEAAGASELVYRAMQRVSQAWTLRGPQTSLTQAFVEYAGVVDIQDLLEGYTTGRLQVGGDAAPLVFQAAREGDPVAHQLVDWAGKELGQLAVAVVRQLNFQHLDFDLVLVGGMFEAGSLLIEPLRETVLQLAPGARLVRLDVPPLVGALLLGMGAGGLQPTLEIRQVLESYFN